MLISVVLVAVTSIVSQTVSGYVFSADSRKPLVGSLVSIFAGDSLTAIGETNKDGLFLLATPDNGINSLVVTAMGYKDYEMDFRPDTISQTMRLYLNKDSKEINLSEIIVTADRSKSVKRTANGQIFYLSSKAKKLSNPFMAMQEIPLLKSDHVNSTISLIGDKKTLVLINGNPMAKVDPILPKNIESVEVINVVPARYLQEGYEGIINIKLKPDAAPYLWIQGATRHDIPLGHGLGVGYFEIGNTKYSLFGRASADYTLHRDINSSINRGIQAIVRIIHPRSVQIPIIRSENCFSNGVPGQRTFSRLTCSLTMINPKAENMERESSQNPYRNHTLSMAITIIKAQS